MISFKVTYKGKPYNSLMDAFNEAVNTQVTELIQKKLAPFKDELNRAGATVRVDLDENYKGNIIIENVPNELKEQVEQAVRS